MNPAEEPMSWANNLRPITDGRLMLMAAEIVAELTSGTNDAERAVLMILRARITNRLGEFGGPVVGALDQLDTSLAGVATRTLSGAQHTYLATAQQAAQAIRMMGVPGTFQPITDDLPLAGMEVLLQVGRNRMVGARLVAGGFASEGIRCRPDAWAPLPALLDAFEVAGIPVRVDARIPTDVVALETADRCEFTKTGETE